MNLKEKFKGVLCKSSIIVLVLFVVCLALDLITKGIFCSEITKADVAGTPTPIIDGFISILPIGNSGMAWSLLNKYPEMLAVISVVLFFGLCVCFVMFRQDHWLFSASMGLMMAGAMGNLIDRVFLGFVRDFIKLDFIDFPIFNFADSCLCVGAVMICVYIVFIYKSPEKKSVEEEK